MRKILTSFILFLLLPILAQAETTVPKLTSHLNDTAGMVAPHLRGQLEARLSDFEKETSNQVVILTVPTIENEDIFSFSQKVFETWKLGQKSKDNGVLIMIVKDRLDKDQGKSIRIHTGRGLEGALPDITCRHIVTDFMKPLMKEKKYAESFNIGIDKLIAATKGEYKPIDSDVVTSKKETSTSSSGGIIIIGLIIFFILSLISSILGGITAGITAFLILPSSLGGGLILAIVAMSILIGWGIAWIINQAARSNDFSLGSGDWSIGSSIVDSIGSAISGGGGDSGGGGGGD